VVLHTSHANHAGVSQPAMAEYFTWLMVRTEAAMISVSKP
jgi:hypothetical protein